MPFPSALTLLIGLTAAPVPWKRVSSPEFPLAQHTRCRLTDSCDLATLPTPGGDWTLVRLPVGLQLLSPTEPYRKRIVTNLPDSLAADSDGWRWHWTLRSPDSSQCLEFEGLLDDQGLLLHPRATRLRGCRPGDTPRWTDPWHVARRSEITTDSVNEAQERARGMRRQGIEVDDRGDRRPLVFKPILYLHPSAPTKVRVELDSSIDVVASHPVPHGLTWTVRADPDGHLVDLASGRSHHGLFWESQGWKAPTSDSGWVVPFARFGSVLDSLLELQGLDYRARGEFVTFWIARFHATPYIAIRFENQAYAKAHPLRITPTPDSWLRVFAVFTPLSSPAPRTPQRWQVPSRSRGFHAVEWGAQVEEP